MGACAASAIGLLTAVEPTLGLAAVAVAIVVPAAVLRPKLIVYVLVVTIFANTLALGGVTIGRLAAPLATIAVISQLLSTQVRVRNGGAVLAATLGYSLLAIASLTWSVDSTGTLRALGALAVSLAYMGAFAVLVRTTRDLERLVYFVVLCSSLLACFWIVSYLSGVDRRFNEAGDPNFFAALQVVAIPLAVVLASFAQTTPKRFALYLSVALIAGSVISTLSRGGVITLAAATLVMLAIPARKLFRTRAQKAAYFLAASLGLVVLLSFAWGDVARRFEVGFRQENLAEGRADLWRAAIRVYEDEPLVGVGFGGFRTSSYQYLRETPGVRLEPHLRFKDSGEYVHSAYLGSLAELGPAGLLLFVALLVTTGRLLLRTARRARLLGNSFVASIATAAAVGLLAFSVASTALSSETSRTLWTIVGLSLALSAIVAGVHHRYTVHAPLGAHDRRSRGR